MRRRMKTQKNFLELIFDFMSETRDYEPVAESFSTPPIIKYSEMMAYVKYPNGRREKLSEIGNPNYPEVEKLIEINPDGSFVFQTGEGPEKFPQETYFEVLHDLGFVRAKDLFDAGKSVLSETEFYGKLAELSRLTRDKVTIVQSVAKAAGLQIPFGHEFIHVLLNLVRQVRLIKMQRELEKSEKDFVKINRVVNEAARKGFFPSPEEMAKSAVDAVLDFNEQIVGTAIERDILGFRESQILSARDENKMREEIVSFFYFYCRIKNGQVPPELQNTKENLRKFPFSSWLLDEYERNADGRFGDSLLVACSELLRELKTAE